MLEPAVAATVTVPLAGATKLTSHVMAAPTARLASGVAGKQTMLAPGGRPLTVHVALAAALGPLLKQLIVPVTVLPAGALAGMPEIVATISALGVMAISFVSTLLFGLLSCVRLPATVLTEMVPLAGALNVDVQVMTPAGAASVAGIGSGAQVWLAPAGKPTSAQVGVVATLGPRLVQVPLTVTDCPAIAVGGAVVCARMSAMGTMPTDCCVVLLAGTGSSMLLAAVPVMVTSTLPATGAMKLTLQTMLWPTGSGLGTGLGTQLDVAPDGNELTAQLAPGAGLGPLFVQVTTPFTVDPAGAVAGKPDTTACISASGVMDNGWVSTLLLGVGSVVPLAAVVMMLNTPEAGAVKVLVQVTLAPTASELGIGFGTHVCVAPDGNPPSTQVGAPAALGPALLQVPLTVTGCPAMALAGTVVTACMSARGTAVTVADAELFALTGSAVVVLAVTATVTDPMAGTTKLTAHEIVALSARLATGEGGTQVTTAPAGSAPIAQPADAALLGPLLVQVTVPLTVLPAGAVAGNPLTAAAISAWGTTATDCVLTLLPTFGSDVELPAVVVMFNEPEAGAPNVLVQVTEAPSASGFGVGFGRQDWVAPGGNPLKLQVGAAAELGPLFVQVPETVTGCPAATDAGTVVTAAMSA